MSVKLKSKLLSWVKKLLYIILAIAIMSVAVNMFLAPHNIAAGGFTGLAIILEELLGIDRALSLLAGNAAIIVITLIFLGKEIFFNTVIGAALLPFVIGIIPHVNLVADTMLSMITGSVLFGIAVSILYSNKASSGGTSIPPLIFKKYFNLNTSVGLFVTDGVVVFLNLLVFSVDSFFYAIASIFITSAAMTYIESGLNKKKLVYIISEMHEKISADIMHEVGRGVTLVPVIGAYSRNNMKMLMVTLDSKSCRKITAIVNKYDEKAFMITDTVSDVYGKGFTYESGSV
ncbi:MAG: YitT family protein [Oscillospiraceae bacterium]|nr:YitT family protein [Oscillospiraceae bacterium]